MTNSPSRHSYGLLVYRGNAVDVEVLIVHPGGPLWAGKDAGAWSIPKGLAEPGESPLATARREFAEEMGQPAPDGSATELGDVRQKSGKTVTAFAIAGDLDVSTVTSNTFEMIWPPRSGTPQQFPEVDRAEWVPPDVARAKLNPAQAEFVDRLLAALDDGGGASTP